MAEENNKKSIWVLIKNYPYLYIPLTIAILIPLLYYFIVFGKYGLSTNSSSLSNFSGFVNLFVSAANLYIFFILSVKVYEYNAKHDETNDSFQRSLERPVCVFITDNKTEDGLDKWKIRNVGRGAALNLHIGFFENGADKWDTSLVKTYSLSANEELELKWLHKKQCNRLVAFYGGVVSGQPYCTIGEGDYSTVIDKETQNLDIVKSLEKQNMYFNTTQELKNYNPVKRIQEVLQK